MERLAKETALWIRTGPIYTVPKTMLRRRSDEERQWNGWTLMEAQAWKKDGCLAAPPDSMAGTWENRRAFLQAPWRAPPKVFVTLGWRTE